MQNRDDQPQEFCSRRKYSEYLGNNCEPSVLTSDESLHSPSSDSSVDPSSQSLTWQGKLQEVSPDRNSNIVAQTLCQDQNHSLLCDSLWKDDTKANQDVPTPPGNRNINYQKIKKNTKEIAVEDLAVNIKRNLQIEGIRLQQKCVTIIKVNTYNEE